MFDFSEKMKNIMWSIILGSHLMNITDLVTDYICTIDIQALFIVVTI
jgi:hypothetical protein